jgi:lipopolysaccharide/colanic/teichoic acid biosynthesis glycosyltransferase
MRNSRLTPLLQRFTATQTLPGRWLLSCHVPLRRCLWRCIVNGASAAKRLCDVVFSLAALVAFSPVFGVIALLIKLEDGGPVLFKQTRVGKFGREFTMYKFRSMCMDAEARLKELLAKNHHAQGVTFKMKDDPRLTRVGKWLRKISFDELPQFFNVLKGEMSLVGPRPPVPREVALYSMADRRRLAAKPGITCIWQISGRAEIDFSGQVKLDVKYIESQNIITDLEILVKTIPAVVSGKGAC